MGNVVERQVQERAVALWRQVDSDRGALIARASASSRAKLFVPKPDALRQRHDCRPGVT